jgi:shikimate kinase
MIEPQTNIILIGMAGSGKSSIGRLLAQALDRDFTDTDNLMERAAGCPLQKIIEEKGLPAFRRLEEDILLSLRLVNHVIATGGSSIYSRRGMEQLKENGITVFLDVALSLLQIRIRNFAHRGLVKHPQQSFGELYIERMPLYREHADYIFSCGTMDEQEICNGLVHLVQDIH